MYKLTVQKWQRQMPSNRLKDLVLVILNESKEGLMYEISYMVRHFKYWLKFSFLSLTKCTLISKVLIILNLQFRASYVGCQSVRASKAISDKMLQENDFQIYLHFNKRNIQYSRELIFKFRSGNDRDIYRQKLNIRCSIDSHCILLSVKLSSSHILTYE